MRSERRCLDCLANTFASQRAFPKKSEPRRERSPKTNSTNSSLLAKDSDAKANNGRVKHMLSFSKVNKCGIDEKSPPEDWCLTESSQLIFKTWLNFWLLQLICIIFERLILRKAHASKLLNLRYWQDKNLWKIGPNLPKAFLIYAKNRKERTNKRYWDLRR